MDQRRKYLFLWLALSLVAVLAACGEGSGQPSLASASDVSVLGSQKGVTPFIAFAELRGNSLARVRSIDYTIEPKAGTISKPVHVTYTIDALNRRGYVANTSGMITLPVFGLYAGYDNLVSLQLVFEDTSTQIIPVVITTDIYSDPNGIYDHPVILKKRAAGSVLGFDFFAMKSGLGTPIIVDTDAEIRWAGIGIANAFSSAFHENRFVIGDQRSTKFQRLELDGSIEDAFLVSTTYTGFHHNINPGKQALLLHANAESGGVAKIESVVAEFDTSGAIIKEWDFADLLTTYMRTLGDDPGAFVRPGVDWFHTNAATYDPRDDSLIVSSRENFIIKVDYSTGNIIWILGDPTKYWYTFPSLRAKAVRLEDGGLYPVGQHATSITSDGFLMLFNNGTASVNQPAGAPVGESRSYSAVSAYSINATTLIAREVWRFDYDRTVLSRFCSSAYEASGKSLLVSYATANNLTKARLVGLNASRDVVFDFEYLSAIPCATSWNATPVNLDDMEFV